MEEKFNKVLETIKAYPKQLEQAWREVGALSIPEDYKNIKNIVFCGMGGSALGARMVDSLLVEHGLGVPFEIFTEYSLPDYTNEDTLVVVSSYSGNTEETLSGLDEAKEKGAKIFGLTTGGKLAERLKKDGTLAYIFNPINNPSMQPRMAIGYASGALLSLLTKLSLVRITEEDIASATKAMADSSETGDLVQKIKGKIPILVASEHLVGVTHTIKNQFNESAKTFAALFDLPELNHHLMEGLANPPEAKKTLHFIFMSSQLYSKRVQKRYPLTAEVIAKNSVEYSIYEVRSATKIAQVYEVLSFGSLLVYQLTKELDIDPTSIPWVDYFKARLSK